MWPQSLRKSVADIIDYKSGFTYHAYQHDLKTGLKAPPTPRLTEAAACCYVTLNWSRDALARPLTQEEVVVVVG